jgi:hypothetical protein
MNYLVAVVADRAAAERACNMLQKADIPAATMTILGQGYQSMTEYGLVDPRESARRRIRWMAVWLIPFGSFGGITFTRMTNLDTFAFAGQIGSYAISGIVGALSGLLGSVFVGGGSDNGVLLGKDAVPYQKRLDTGKYLVVVKGSDPIVRRSNKLMRDVDPESLQIYGDDLFD